MVTTTISISIQRNRNMKGLIREDSTTTSPFLFVLQFLLYPLPAYKVDGCWWLTIDYCMIHHLVCFCCYRLSQELTSIRRYSPPRTSRHLRSWWICLKFIETSAPLWIETFIESWSTLKLLWKWDQQLALAAIPTFPSLILALERFCCFLEQSW